MLVLKACPQHEIIHKIVDYSVYYDTCYFPEMHENYFETMETVESWLLPGLDDHKRYCETCSSLNICIQAVVNIFRFVLALNLSYLVPMVWHLHFLLSVTLQNLFVVM